MENIRHATTRFVIVILITALVVAVSFLLHVLFSKDITDLTVEILAAVLGVVLVVASVGVTIHFQQKAEKERQFHIAIFQTKLKLYRELLDCIVVSDDDHVITPCEIEKIRNMSRVVALVGSKELIGTLASFVERITREKKLDLKNDQEDNTFPAVIQRMREDLDVVEGDVKIMIQRLNEARRLATENNARSS